jgi:hypothetical protein
VTERLHLAGKRLDKGAKKQRSRPFQAAKSSRQIPPRAASARSCGQVAFFRFGWLAFVKLDACGLGNLVCRFAGLVISDALR